jgi:hypothetical protein
MAGHHTTIQATTHPYPTDTRCTLPTCKAQNKLSIYEGYIKLTIISIQTNDKENISINKLNYKQINKRANKILTRSN